MGDLPEAEVALLDLDGTLVDSNYQHALAWYRSFREHDLVLPVWRIHRAIGMGGDNLVVHLAGDEVEQRLGDAIRAAQTRHYEALVGEVAPLEQAHDLIVDLKQRGLTVILASSATETDVLRYLDLLDARQLVDGWTTGDEVEATKPEPDLIQAALEKGGGGKAFMLGDTTWDIIAARRAGVPTVCVMTGGFSADELTAEGALAVYDAIPALRRAVADAFSG